MAIMQRDGVVDVSRVVGVQIPLGEMGFFLNLFVFFGFFIICYCCSYNYEYVHGHHAARRGGGRESCGRGSNTVRGNCFLFFIFFIFYFYNLLLLLL